MTAQPPSDPEANGPQTSVQALMTRAVARIDPQARLFEVAQKLSAVEAGALAVGTTEAVIGMVSERDVTRAYGRNDDPDVVAAGDIASTDILWCRPEVSAADAAQIMCDQGVRHLLVGDATNGDLHGIVSARDLIEALIGS
ncbi:MAG: CBS domain-containing protein [Actinomycetia bacterium]|nr:CBS domain-containing protein [Actinomycetes bacterium]MCP5035410.1 CBS domain-containing protein [Actinomycetes bacterium]